MPQKFQSERLYINTILKLSYYFHALSRFDKPAAEREKANLIVLFADEGQEIITGAESAFADHRAAGIIREARATMVLATQAYTSLHGSLDRRYADVLMLNLSNELIFTCANHESALIAGEEHRRTGGCGKDLGLGGGEANQQLPAHHQALLPGVQAAQAAEVHPHRPPLREAVPQAADSADQPGRVLPKMVHAHAPRLCRSAVA
jgi:hypothetical protein